MPMVPSSARQKRRGPFWLTPLMHLPSTQTDSAGQLARQSAVGVGGKQTGSPGLDSPNMETQIPLAQTTPHPPQLPGSWERSTQASPQH